MSSNVISINRVRLSSPVDKEFANYTVYTDGTIHIKQRGLELYGESARRLGIDIRQLRTVGQIRNLQFRSWKLTLSDVSQSCRISEDYRRSCHNLLKASTSATA